MQIYPTACYLATLQEFGNCLVFFLIFLPRGGKTQNNASIFTLQQRVGLQWHSFSEPLTMVFVEIRTFSFQEFLILCTQQTWAYCVYTG